MKKILVRYGPNGEIEIEAEGYHGKGCKEASKFIEDALGEVADVKEKAEWWIANGRSVRETKEVHNLSLDKLCG